MAYRHKKFSKRFYNFYFSRPMEEKRPTKTKKCEKPLLSHFFVFNALFFEMSNYKPCTYNEMV